MKTRFLLFLSILFFCSGFCKAPENYWNPKGNFPALKANGAVSSSDSESFNFDHAPADADILFINFFAPECKPCIIEVPDLKKIYGNVKDNPKIKFIGIGSVLTSLSEEVDDYSKVAPEVSKFVKGFGIPYTVYVGLTKDLKNYGLTGFPETFILHRNEKGHWFVKRRFVGMITERDVMPFLH